MSRILYRIGHFSGRHPWRVLAAWLVIVASVFLLNGSIGLTFRTSRTGYLVDYGCWV
jgi:uncharacterized membrane protein YdfJ with MMPL/SSD domain